MMQIVRNLAYWLRPLVAPVARFVSRHGLSAATGASVLWAAAEFIAPFEGVRLEAYLDRVASPPVWTVCYGETRGVGRGDSYTAEECDAMLLAAVGEYHAGLLACLPSLAEQPTARQVALTSWTYNVGLGAACRSTLVRFARQGAWHEACDELLRWNNAGGRPVQGLTRRRIAERELCRGVR